MRQTPPDAYSKKPKVKCLSYFYGKEVDLVARGHVFFALTQYDNYTL